MNKYRFFCTANKQQDDIWEYSCNKWGEDQASRYIIELHEYIKLLSNKSKPWYSLPKELINPMNINKEVYFGKYKSHYIYFHELLNGDIGIISILHNSMDIPIRLKNDLTDIQKKKELNFDK